MSSTSQAHVSRQANLATPAAMDAIASTEARQTLSALCAQQAVDADLAIAA